jgi:hypothetical protein
MGLSLMQAAKEHEIRERAYFIAGVPARNREHSPLVESAIHDAVDYLKALPKNIDEPTLSGGTKTAAEQIVTFYWLVQNAGKIKAVTIAFRGNGICIASWPGRFGKDHKAETATVAEALALKLPEKVRDLRGRFGGPRGPDVK